MKPLAKGSNTFDRVLNIMAVVTAILVAFAAFSVCFEVGMRFFLHRPQGWVHELSEYSLVWITFLGAAWLLKEEGHVTIDAVLRRLSPRTQSLLNIITSTLCVIIWLALIWYSGRHVWRLQSEGVLTTWLEIPRAPFYAIMPIGSFLLFIQFLRRTYGFLGDWRASSKKEQHSQR